MENKEEILRALNIGIKGYTEAIEENFQYGRLMDANLHTGVCRYLVEQYVRPSTIELINQKGMDYVKNNKPYFRKKYDAKLLPLKNEVVYWFRYCPCVSVEAGMMKNSLIARLDVLCALKRDLLFYGNL